MAPNPKTQFDFSCFKCCLNNTQWDYQCLIEIFIISIVLIMLNASYIIIKSLTWFFLSSSYNKEVDDDKNDEDKNNETADNSSDQRCVWTIWNTIQMEHMVNDCRLIFSDKAIILIFIIIVVYFVFDKSEKKKLKMLNFRIFFQYNF